MQNKNWEKERKKNESTFLCSAGNVMSMKHKIDLSWRLVSNGCGEDPFKPLVPWLLIIAWEAGASQWIRLGSCLSLKATAEMCWLHEWAVQAVVPWYQLRDGSGWQGLLCSTKETPLSGKQKLHVFVRGLKPQERGERTSKGCKRQRVCAQLSSGGRWPALGEGERWCLCGVPAPDDPRCIHSLCIHSPLESSASLRPDWVPAVRWGGGPPPPWQAILN